MPIGRSATLQPSFPFLQSFLQTIDNHLFCCLSLPIALGVCEWWVSIGYTEVAAVFPKKLTIKLQPIIGYQHLGNSEPCDNVLPHEFFFISTSLIFTKALVSTHFVNSPWLLPHTICPPEARRKGPTISNPHWAKGQGLAIRSRLPSG